MEKVCLQPCSNTLKCFFFNMLVNELLCEKFPLLLTARAILNWRLLLHQRRAKPPKGKGSAGGRVLSSASQEHDSAIINHQSNFSPTDGFQPIARFHFRSKQSLFFPVSLSFQNGGWTSESRGFPLQLLWGSSRLAKWDLGEPALTKSNQEKIVWCVLLQLGVGSRCRGAGALGRGETQPRECQQDSILNYWVVKTWLSGRTKRMNT